MYSQEEKTMVGNLAYLVYLFFFQTLYFFWKWMLIFLRG